jgi:hypothetical protein
VAASYIAKATKSYNEMAAIFDGAKLVVAVIAASMDLDRASQTGQIPDLPTYAAPSIPVTGDSVRNTRPSRLAAPCWTRWLASVATAKP